VNKYSFQPLIAVGNALGYIQVDYFPEVFASHGGLPSPVCVRLQAGYIIGSSNPVQIDQYGNNLTSACNVPGGDATAVFVMSGKAGIDKTKVVKFLERERQYKIWNDNKAKRAVVPVVTVTSHPMTTQYIDSIHHGTARTKNGQL
jgi:hypothetical protein